MKKLSFTKSIEIFGGASVSRCYRMADRWQRRGGETRLQARIRKNCAGIIGF